MSKTDFDGAKLGLGAEMSPVKILHALTTPVPCHLVKYCSQERVGERKQGAARQQEANTEFSRASPELRVLPLRKGLEADSTDTVRDGAAHAVQHHQCRSVGGRAADVRAGRRW